MFLDSTIFDTQTLSFKVRSLGVGVIFSHRVACVFLVTPSPRANFHDFVIKLRRVAMKLQFRICSFLTLAPWLFLQRLECSLADYFGLSCLFWL